VTIGGSIALLVVGAILAFAVNLDLPGLDLKVVGFILMLAGVVGLVFSVMNSRARRGDVVEERRVYDDRETY
jgi:uncharacterized membrane protein